jgi:HK97 family phage portal protein
MNTILRQLGSLALSPTRLLTRRKAVPRALLDGPWTTVSSTVDVWRRMREPTPSELIGELKGAAWSCISLNASMCATYPPKLYVVTKHNQPRPKCTTGERYGEKSAAVVEEVTAHPLLDLLRRPNQFMNSVDLWELTQTYLEVTGKAYWYLEPGPFGVPGNIWVLPSQNVTPRRHMDSKQPIDYFEYRTGKRYQEFPVEQIAFFRFPDPRDPYTGGLSPLRACYEQVLLTSEFAATKSAIYENRGLPSALVSPESALGEEERTRLEHEWNMKFHRGGAGKVVVAETGLKVQLLNQSLGDIAALADMKATKEDIANAFHVPIAFLTTQTNLANLQASQSQHMAQAIAPRLQRRDEKLNQFLVPFFDPSERLFFSSENPVPVDQDASLAQLRTDLQFGILSINEVRSGRGLPPVPWGDSPWLPTRWAPATDNRDPKASVEA